MKRIEATFLDHARVHRPFFPSKWNLCNIHFYYWQFARKWWFITFNTWDGNSALFTNVLCNIL